MEQTFTQMVETSNNNAKQPCGFTRARAHAPIERACARTFKPLLLNAAVIVAVMLGIGAGNVWAQTPLQEGTHTYSSGDYIVPEGFYISKIECIGGGGGGQAGPIEYWWGNPVDGEDGGIGGGGGGYSVFTPSDLTFGTVITVVVGRGGAGGKSNSQISENGEDGYPSYVTLNGSTLVTAGGGKAGGVSTWVSGQGYVYGLGGTGTYGGGNGGGIDDYAGGGGGGAAGPDGPGGNGGASSSNTEGWGPWATTNYVGGVGGSSGGDPAGGGGTGYADTDNGGSTNIKGKTYGGGGGGGFRYTTSSGYRPGGDGADGCVRITVSPISEMSEAQTDPPATYIVPPGYYVEKIEAWGGGGGGQGGSNDNGGRGGGGGGYGCVTPYPNYFIASGETLNVVKGGAGTAGSTGNNNQRAGGPGGSSTVKWVTDNNKTLIEVYGGYAGGAGGNNAGRGRGANGSNDYNLAVTQHTGGNGATNNGRTGGGGGGGAGSDGDGSYSNTYTTSSTGGSGGTGNPNGKGGDGGGNRVSGSSGNPFGGGGGAGGRQRGGGSGADGGVYIHIKPIFIRVVLHGSTSDFTASQPAVWSNLEEDKSYPVVLYHSFNSQPALNAYMTTGVNTTSSLTRTGYTFAGWYSASGHNVVTSAEEIDPDVFTNDIVWDATNTHHISGELHLYAHWTPKEYHFYVNLDKNFDSDVDDFVDSPADDNGNIPADNSCNSKFKRPDNNSRYYFVVKFDGQLNGEVTIQNDEVTTSCIEEIHRNGYLQDGWFWSYDATDREFDNQIDWTKMWNKTDFSDYDFDNNTFTDIYLRWKPAPYNVTLKANTYNSQAHFADQQTDTIIKVDYNRPYGTTLGDVLPTTSESGFIFRGWSTVEDTTTATGTTVNADSIFKNHSTTNPTKLYAKWEREIDFDLASTDVLCHGGSTGQIHVTNIQYGNGSSYTVSISGPTQKDPVITTDGTADFTGLEAGKYYVTIKDANHQSDDEKCITTDSITVIDPPVLNVTLTPHNPNCDTLNGSVEVKITGGVKPYTGMWKAANESGTHPLDLTLTTDGDSAVFEQFVDAERTYTVSVTDKNGCPAEATKTLQPRVDPFHFDYPVSKLNVCSGSKFSVNPTDFPLNPTDPPLHTTTETKNSAPEGTRYSWSMPTCSDPDLTDFNGEEGHSETDVNGRILNTTENVVTITYTVTPTNGYYCIGDPFTVTVEVNPGDADNTVELTANAVDNLCVTGGNVSVTVNNAANNSTLTWVLERVTESATVHDTVQVDVLENPSDEETISHAVPGIIGCSADSVYMVYYNDASGCSSELRKTVQLEIEAWNMDEYSDQTSDKYTPNETTVNCVRQVVRPTAAMLPPITGDNAVKAGCGLATDTVLVSAPTADDLKCDGTYIYKYRYFVVDCPENYQEWTYTYIVEGEDTPPTITLTETAEAGVQAITTGLCGYRVPDLVGVSNRGTYMSVSDANQCTGDGGLIFSQSPAANTLITQTTNVTVSVTDSCGKNTAEKTIVVTVPDPLTLPELTSTGVTCYGYENGTIKPQTTNATATGGTPDYLYYVDGNSSVTQATLDFANLAGGNHLVSVKDANNCVASKVVAVEEPTPLTATVSVTDVDCKDNSTGSITIVAAGGTPGTDAQDNPVNYWYRMGESGTYQNDGRVDSVFKQLAAGTYKVYAKDANGCELPKEVEVKEPLRPLTLVVSPDDAVCYGSTTSVFVSANGGNGGYEYTWYTTSVDDPVYNAALYPITPAPEVTTTYHIFVTDAKGCEKTGSVTVTVNPLVELAILTNQTQSVCLNNQIDPVAIRTNVPAENLIANGLPMYVNVNVSETDTVISGMPIVAGTYQYTVWGISQYGCPPKTVSGTLVVYPAFTPGSITDGETEICYGADLSSVTSTSPANGGNGTMHYKWQYSTDNQATWSDIDNVDAADLAAGSMPAGSNHQTTSFRRWAQNDCSAYVDEEEFDVDEDGWVLSTGTYTIKVNDTVAVAITGADIACIQGSLSGDVLELGMTLGDGVETVDPANYTYNWTLGDNEGGVPVGSATGTGFSVSWTTPAGESNPKHVYLTVTETATGCVSHAKKTVLVNNPELTLNGISVFNITEDETYGGAICKDASVRLTANTTAVDGNTNYYTWKVGETVVKNASTEASFETTPAVTTTYTVEVYAVKEVNNVPCTTAVQSREVTITVNDPQVTLNNINIYNHTNNNDVLLTSNTVCYGTTVKLEADATSNAPRTYSWKLNDQTEAVTDHPLIITLTENTTFHFSVTAHVGDCPKTVSKDTTVYVRPAFDPGTINVGNDSKEICFGADNEIQAIPNTPAVGGESPVAYRWYVTFADNTKVLVKDSTTADADFTPIGYYDANEELFKFSDSAGVYIFTREAKDQACEDWTQSVGSYTLTVDEEFNPGTIASNGQNICWGEEVNAIGSVEDATGGRGLISYQWYHKLGDGAEELIAGAEDATFLPSDLIYTQTSGKHYFTRKAADEVCQIAGLPSSGTYMLEVYDTLELVLPLTAEVCASGSLANEVLTLTENSQDGNTEMYYYYWMTGSGEGATIVSGQTDKTVKVKWPNDGTGHITLEVEHKIQGCLSSRTVLVTVDTVPEPTISGDNSVCQNSTDFSTSVELTVSPTDLTTYNWTSYDDGTASDGYADYVKNVSWTSLGNHTVQVTVTDSKGCSADTTKTVYVNSLPILSLNTTPVQCNGGNDGVIEASASNGAVPYVYTVNSDSSNTTGRFDGYSYSTNTITVTDANGCKAQGTAIVNQASGFTLKIDSIYKTSCAGNDGMIKAEVIYSNPTEVFQFKLFDSLQTQIGTVQLLTPGMIFKSDSTLKPNMKYRLQVYRFNEIVLNPGSTCFSDTIFEVPVNNTLEIVEIPAVSPKCSGDSFEVTPVVNITTGTTTYSWNVGGVTISDPKKVYGENLVNTTGTIQMLTYQVTATNVNCTAESSFEVELRPEVTVEPFSGDVKICPDIREVLLEVQFNNVVGNDNKTVTWSFGEEDYEHGNLESMDNHLADDVTISLPNAYDTSYTYTVTYTDGVCTADTQGRVVVPKKLVMVTDEVSMISCRYRKDGRVELHASGGTAPYNYLLHIGDPAYGADSIQSGASATFGNLYLPRKQQSWNANIQDWQADITADGDSIHYVYYPITITDNRGCTINDSVYVWAPDTMRWLNIPDPIHRCCDVDDVIAIEPGVLFTPIPSLSQTLTQNGNITFSGDGKTQGPKLSQGIYVKNQKSYTYSVKDRCKSKGQSLSKSISVTVYPNLTMQYDQEDLASQDICFGNPIQDIQVTFTNATLKDTLLPPGVTLNQTTGLISGTPSEQLTTSKTYNYLIIATSNQSASGFAGCGSDTLRGSITVNPAPTITSLTSTKVNCAGEGGTITVTTTSGNAIPNVYMALDDGEHNLVAGMPNQTKTYSVATAKEYVITVWSVKLDPEFSEGCSTSATIDVTLDSPYLEPTNHKFSDTTYAHLCSGDSFDTLPKAPTFQNYATTYKWEAPMGDVTGGAAATTAQNTVNGGPLSNTTNTVQNAVYTVTPTTGTVCEGPVFTVTVPVNPTVVMNRPASQVVCSDSTIDAVQFSSTITDGTMSYSWSRDNTENVTGLDASGTSNINAVALKNTTTTVQTVTFTVTPTYTNGGVSCTGDTMKFSIKVNPEVLLSVDNEANLTQTIVYGQPITDVVFSYSEHATLTHTNLPAGVEYNTSTNTLSGTPAAAGNYTVTFTANSTQTPNCGKKEKVVTINVAKAALTVTADDKTKVYGESDPDLTWTITNGLQNGDTKDSLVSTGALVVTISRAQAGTPDGENVGTYAITPAGEATQGNYTVTYVPGNLTITRANVTVKAEAKEKNYGENDPTLTATVSGLQNNDAASVIAYTISRTAGENVGEYVITPTGAATQGNYTVTYETAKFTIKPVAVTVKADAKSKYFGTADPTLTAMVTGLQNGDAENAITYTISRAQAGTADGENVGEYVITPTGAATQGNYTVTYETAKLTINPVDVTVAVTGNTAMLVENGSNQSVEGFTATASNSQYKVSGENPDFRLKANETAVATRSTVGKTYMGLTASKFENVNSNYNVTIQEVTDGWIEIVPTGTVIVNITGHTATTDYDAQEHVVSGYVVQIVNPDPTTTYTKNDFTFTGDSTLAETNAGTYPMGLAENQFTNTNADFANVMFHITDGGLTINKVNATVTVAGNYATHAYDGVEHVIENYVVSNVTPAFYTEDDFTFSGMATATRTNAGTTYMGLAESQFANTNANFDHVTFQVTDGFQTIEPIAVDVAIKGHTLMHEYTTFEQSVEGFDTITSSTLLKPADIVFSGYAVATGTVPDTYPMGLTTNQFSCGNPNFNVTFTVEDGWLQIVPAGIVIVNITGNTATKDYNCEEQSVSGYTYTIGGVDENNQPYANIYNDPSYFKLNGTTLDSTATRTNAGTTYMGLTVDKFQNLNTFFNVEFHVVDGWLTINKVTASMKIKGNTDEVTYDGDPHTVTGYSITDVSPSCYNTQYVQFTGTTADSTATRTDAGTTNMNLVAGLFQNASTNSNFEVVTFTVENGFMKVNPLEEVTVTLHGNTSTVDYDGQSHTVTGYTVDNISSDLYTANDFSLAEGVEATATRKNVVEGNDADGKTSMGLTPESFVNLNPNFGQVNFVVTDGYQEVKPINATITAIDQTYTYNASAQGENNATYTNASDIAAKVTVTGLLNGETLTSIKLNGQKTNAGEYPSTIVPSEAVISSGSSNYNIAYVEGKLTINNATLTITAKDQTYTYNGSAQGPAGTYTTGFDTYVTVSGLQGNDALTSITLSGSQTNQGTYTDEIVPSAAAVGNNTGNYTITYVEGDLTINKATLTITAKDQTYTYNGSAQGPAGTYTENFSTYVTVTGLQGNDALTIITLSGSQTNQGTYTDEIVPSVAAVGNNTGNYNITYVEGDLTINKATLTITAKDQTYTYNGSAQGSAGTYTADFDTYVTVTGLQGSDALTSITLSGIQTNQGTYTDEIVPSAAIIGNNTGDYEITYVEGDLTIGKATLTITAKDQTYTYNGSAQGPAGTYTENFSTYVTVTGLQGNDALTSITLSGIQTNQGTYTDEIVPSAAAVGSNTGNYTITYVEGDLTINKATLTITAKDQTYTYNGSAQGPAGTYTSGFDTYVTLSGLQGNDALTSITLSGIQTNQGTYTDEIVPSAAAIGSNTGNYNIEYVEGDLTINKATLTITAKDQTYTYNGSAQGPAGTYTENFDTYVTVSGLKGNDVLTSITLSGSQTNQGTYTDEIVPSAAVIGSSTGNYNITYVEGDLTINKATLTITAKDQTYTYNGSAQGPAGTYTADFDTYVTVTGLQGSDALTSITMAGSQMNQGTYENEIIPSAAVVGSNTGNYDITYNKATLTINKATVTITAKDQTYTYNGSAQGPAGTYTANFGTYVTVSGLQGNDALTSITLSGSQTNQGTYTDEIVPSVAAIGSNTGNYDIAYVEGDLTINKATLTITALPKTYTYNGSAQGPAGTYTSGFDTYVTVTGLQGSDALTSLTMAGSQMNQGTYENEIVPSAAAVGSNTGNYDITYNKATLTINKAALTITALPKTYTYNGSAQGPAGTYITGFSTYVTVEGLLGNDQLTSITMAGSQTNVGEYANEIVPSAAAIGNSTGNYNISYNNALLTINKADLTITINNTNKVYDNSPLVVNYNDNNVSISGNAANAHLTAGKVTTNGTAVGIYTYANQTVTITELFAMSDGIANYNVSYDITMEITQSQVVITCPTAQSDTEKVYDGTPISYEVHASTGTGDPVTVEYSTDYPEYQNWNTTAPSRTDVGETQVYVRAYAANYATQYCQYKLKVTPLAVTVTVTGNHDTKTYDAAEHTVEGYTATATSQLYKVSGDAPDFALASGQTAVAKRTNEGTTNMGLTTNSFVNNNNNFNVTFEVVADGYMTINKHTLTITANAQTYDYNGAAQGENNATYTNATKVTVDGLQGNDALTSIKLNGMETNAGVYTNKIEPSAAAIGNATGNYDITYVKGKLTINTVALTITAKNQEYTYNGNVQGPAGTYTSGFDTYVTVSGLQGSDALSSITMAGGKTNVGEYANEIVPSAAAIGNSTGNYNISYNNATLTINKANLTITVKTSKYYDGTVLEANFDDDSVSLSGNMNNASLTAGKVKTNAATVGAYSYADNTVTINPVFAMSDGISNYNVTYNITMEIKNNVVNMTCTDADRVYDATPFSHSIEATVVHGTPTVEYSLDSLNWTSTAPSRTDAGTTKVYVRASADNYETAACSYNLTVNKRYVKITTPGGIFLYDGNPHGNPGNYTISGDGFVDGHAYNFHTPAWVTALGTCVTDTITYQTSAAFNANNYTIEYQLGQLCISGNAPIVITSASNADPIYYDGQLHGTESAYRTYTVTYDGTEMPVIEGSNGLKFRLPAGDTVTITPTFTGVTFFDDANNTPNNNVFTYTITHDDFYVGPRTLNYGTVNITKRPITFTIAPALASKTYDGTIMTVNATDLTVGGQGLATTDALTAGVVKTDNFVAGEYTCAEGGFQAGYQGVAIKEGFVIKHSNGHITTSSYNPQFNVKLTIDQKAITVTSDDAEKVYDGTELTNSDFAITSGELANGDELYATVTGYQTCVGEGENTISTTTVRRGNTDVTESYNITTVAGTLKVKPITVGFACPQDTTVIMKDDDDNVVVTADIIGQASLVPTTPSVLDHITITNNLDERNPMSEGVDTVTWTLRDECGNAMTTCEQLVTVKYKPCETINHMGYDYPTKRIGHQCWFTEDLRYEFGNYTAYNNLTENAEKFGYLYSWYTAMGVPENTTTVAPTIDTADNGSLYVQGICPEGWAVGSMADFHTLELTAGSISSLKDPSTLYWQNGYEGDNPGTGFNARGGGWYNSTRSRYEDIKTGYHFWKADAPSITTLTNSSTVVSLLISYHCDQILEQTSQKSDRRSVRCIRKKINP